jgi:hypothetical protein
VEFTGAGNFLNKSISSSIGFVVRTYRQSHYDLEIQKRFVAGVLWFGRICRQGLKALLDLIGKINMGFRHSRQRRSGYEIAVAFATTPEKK